MTEAVVEPKIPDAMLRADQLVRNLLGDSKLGPEVRARAKEVFPDANLQFPEDRFEPAMAPLREALEAQAAVNKTLQDRLDAKEASERQKEVEGNLSAALTAAQTKYGLDNEGLDAAVARMKETGNYTDAEAAAAWVAQNAPKPKPAPAGYLGPQNANFYGSNKPDEAFALLHKDPMGAFLDDQFNEFFNDPDKYVQETFAA